MPRTPPTFLLQAEIDYVHNVNQALVYYIALKNAEVPVEMHRYAQGGHAFGLRRTKFPITAWPRSMETWLGSIGVMREPTARCGRRSMGHSDFDLKALYAAITACSPNNPG